MSKLPAIQFYPGDWRKDVGVQSLNFHDRGVWFEMLCLMHESPVRGKLMIGGKAASDEMIANLLHIDLETFLGTVSTLLERKICDRCERTGALTNRRMVRDELRLSKNRARLNRWRKTKKLNGKCNADETQDETPMKPLPSSSSSSSSSSSTSVCKNKKQVRSAKAKPVAEPTEQALFRQDFDKYFQHKNNAPASWDGKEASALSRWMKANPTISRAQWQMILNNRARSPCAHAAPLSRWIGNALAFLNGTADDWGKPTQGGNHGQPGLNRAQERSNGNLAALAEAAAAITGHATADRPGRSAAGRGESADAGTLLLGTRTPSG